MLLSILRLLLLASVFSATLSEDHTKKSFLVVDKNHKIRLDQYLKAPELEALIDNLAENYAHIVKKSLIGHSAKGMKMWAVQISQNVQAEREMLKPMVKLVGNIHGNEAVGYSMLTTLMQYLVFSYGKVPRVTNLLNTTDIWIVPTMNPDGFSVALEGCDLSERDTLKGKRNSNGVDLDLNFPVETLYRQSEPETSHMMDFISNNPFVLSAQLQGGRIVAGYFYFEKSDKKDDEEVFVKLARQFVKLYPLIYSCEMPYFQSQGISDGCGWKKRAGGMQLANYVLSNCIEMIFYVSCCGYPRASELPIHWYSSQNHFLSFMETARTGIYGLIRDEQGNPIKEAVVTLQGYKKEIKGTDREPRPLYCDSNRPRSDREVARGRSHGEGTLRSTGFHTAA